MAEDVHIIRRALRTSALYGMLTLFATPAFAQFNPNAGVDMSAEARPKTRAPSHLPSTAPLMAAQPKLIFPSSTPDTTAMTTPLPSPTGSIPYTVTPATPAMNVTTIPASKLPPVDPAVMRQAQRELAAQPSTIATPPNFSAPAPLMALTPPPAAASVPVTITPVTVTPVKIVSMAPSSSVGAVAPEPIPSSVGAAAPLSPASKAVLHQLPSKIATPVNVPSGKLDLSRMSPNVKSTSDLDKAQTYNAVGLSIKVAKPGLDTNYELNRAYAALMGGDSANAIDIYNSVLSADPSNQDALFGLASTYHRNAELEKARPYYAQLLKINPNHREGLNNFLALVSEESPNEALVELGRLEQKNPDFSPIPAQESIVMNKLGYYEPAREKMLRAIELAPENLTYKYNLAVMLDHHGDYANAGALYRLLIDASLKGEKLPASVDVLQKRLNYISTAVAPVPAIGG